MNDNRSGVTIITGAAGTIGSAVADALADDLGALVLVDRDPDGLAAAAEKLSDRVDIVTVAADVTSEADVARYVEVAGSHGEITGFVNNAGIEGWIGPLADYPGPAFDAVLAVNVKGVFLGLKHALRRMNSGGSVVNMASTAGLRGGANMAAYVASKHAVVGLTRAAAMEAARAGIRVNAVCPAGVEGRMIESIQSSMSVTAPAGDGLSQKPMDRLARPDEIAASVRFLLSTDSSFITGETLAVDGGRTA
ncbi:SDR family NAD(P)-dependent oxidoreductase [Nocardia cyriacigeorgica]|uniref:SDR family NAD(P)-dependent oxidoreductase n=1 Tax=Nocardia cyriacigeorgica TaxID=135487 RepID=UPI0013D382D0|nr:SDR family oxidoreductase [Nocardia cyriacigeorgica]NEW27107.1 SDR family oxidoreductase [Nocardia cyriacigeorgica]